MVAKVEEELRETKEAIETQGRARIEEEIGDMLFAVVNLAPEMQNRRGKRVAERNGQICDSIQSTGRRR